MLGLSPPHCSDNQYEMVGSPASRGVAAPCIPLSQFGFSKSTWLWRQLSDGPMTEEQSGVLWAAFISCEHVNLHKNVARFKRVHHSGKKLVFSSVLVINQLDWDCGLRFSGKYFLQKTVLLAPPLSAPFQVIYLFIYFTVYTFRWFSSCFFYFVLWKIIFCPGIFYVEIFFFTVKQIDIVGE